MQTSVLNFMTVRGPQQVSPAPETDSTIRLVTAPKQDSEVLGMWAVRMFNQFEPYVHDQLGGLRGLNQALLIADDRMEPPAIGDLAVLTYGTDGAVNPVPECEKFQQDELAVASLLVAAIVNPEMNGHSLEVPQLRRELVRLARVLGLIRRLAAEDPSLVDAEAVARYLRSAVLTMPSWFPQPARSLARSPAMADLLVVRMGSAHYELGEIAHVENVLGRELRSRSLQRTDIHEVTTHEVTETVTTAEQDNQTTQRSELQTELQREVQQSQDIGAQVSVSGSYGPALTINANASYASHDAETQATAVSSQFAQEVTTRASMRVQERVLRERTEMTRTETVERNTHEFDNRASDEHVVGIYRWLDKVYDAQVYSLGKRMLLELVIPEPAAWLKWSARSEQNKAVTEACPPKPDLSPSDITEQNYLDLVRKYEALGVEAPDPRYKWVSTVLTIPTKNKLGDQPYTSFMSSSSDQILKVPDGYELADWSAVCQSFLDNAATDLTGHTASAVTTYLTVGPAMFGSTSSTATASWEGFFVEDKRPTGVVPVILTVDCGRGGELSVTARCERRPEHLAQWQVSVYTAIMRAYYDQKSRYDQAVAQAQQDTGLPAMGTNPRRNREIEARELHRAALQILLENYADRSDFEDPAVLEQENGEPKINSWAAAAQQKAIQFMEQGFEWNNMTYVSYPYFWARSDKWSECAQLDNEDALFARFLSAGAARVVLPVRPGFESAVSLYLATGLCWEGGDVPTVGDPMYVSAVQEIADLDRPAEGIAVGTPWQVRLPTTLVMLQQTAELP